MNFIIMRKAVLPEDEGRQHFELSLPTRAAAEAWIAQQQEGFFKPEDFYIAEEGFAGSEGPGTVPAVQGELFAGDQPEEDQTPEGALAREMLAQFEFEPHSPGGSPENPFAKPEACFECPLFREPGPVWGHGPEDSKTMLVGEAPGGEEVNEPRYRPDRMRPFIGGSGKVLYMLAKHAGIHRCLAKHGPEEPCRGESYDTNVVKCRPPGNRKPTDLEIACCSPYLQAEIEQLNPNVIIALGDTPLYALTEKKGITNRRGVVTEGTGIASGRKILPTWHPAFIMRSQFNWPFSVRDLYRAKAEAVFPEIRRIPYDIVTSANIVADGEGVLRAIRARGATCFDFETTGLDPRKDSVVLLGVTTGPAKAYVFDWSGKTSQFLQEVLDDPGIEVVGQNILYFDLPFAEEKGFDLTRAWPKVFDTMVTFHLCNTSYGQTTGSELRGGKQSRGMDKDLTMIASCHTDMEYWKSRDDYQTDLRVVCGKDVIAADRAALDPTDGLKAELKRYDMLDLYYKHVLPVHPVLRRMSKAGIKVDEERAAAWSTTLEASAIELEEKLREAVGDPLLNIDSPKQIMDLLYDKLKLPVQYAQSKSSRKESAVRKETVQFYGGTRFVERPTVNAEAIELLAEQFPEHEILRSIIDIRLLKKLKSTFVDPGLIEGINHPKFGVSKTSTGRINSWDPNGQNVPEDLRDMWVADSKEHVLLACDWSQIEWRIAMVLSGDPAGLEMLSSGVDTHRAIASEVLGKPVSEITDGERYSAKFVVYGLGYGRGAESLATGFGSQRGRVRKTSTSWRLDIDWVHAFIQRFFGKFAVYADWRQDLVKTVSKQQYLVTPFKRRRWWYTTHQPEMYGFPPQSTAADMMYVALMDLDRELPKGATLRLTAHDEAVVCAPMDVALEAALCMRENMEKLQPKISEASWRPENVKRFYPNGWFCPAEIGVGHSWKAAKSKDSADKAARLALEERLGFHKHGLGH